MNGLTDIIFSWLNGCVIQLLLDKDFRFDVVDIRVPMGGTLFFFSLAIEVITAHTQVAFVVFIPHKCIILQVTSYWADCGKTGHLNQNLQ